MAVDALNDGMQVRLSVTRNLAAGATAAVAPEQDLVLIVRHGTYRDEIELPAGRGTPATSLVLDLNGGDVGDYPLDSYTTAVQLDCFVRPSSPSAEPVRVPIAAVAWEGVTGFRVRAREVAQEAAQGTVDPTPGRIGLRFDVRRPGAITLFALAAYGAMVVLALGALTVASMVFVGVRRIEATLLSALGAMVFALPALRNAMPGSPPLGVRADLFVFLWTELAAVIALALFIVAWVRRGPLP